MIVPPHPNQNTRPKPNRRRPCVRYNTSRIAFIAACSRSLSGTSIQHRPWLPPPTPALHPPTASHPPCPSLFATSASTFPIPTYRPFRSTSPHPQLRLSLLARLPPPGHPGQYSSPPYSSQLLQAGCLSSSPQVCPLAESSTTAVCHESQLS